MVIAAGLADGSDDDSRDKEYRAGKAEAILAVLHFSFGEIPETVRSRVLAVTDHERLNELVRKAAVSTCLNEFTDAL